MDFEVVLFQYETSSIKIDIRLGFINEDLILEGYDVGKYVEETRGGSDYEYKIKIKSNELYKLYQLRNVTNGNKKELINSISSQFFGNLAYSQFMKYININHIKFESFSW